MGCFGDRKSLAVMTSISACASFAFLCIAIGTDYWLYATERIIDANQTVTLMTSHNGLWKKCTVDERKGPTKVCGYVSYFKEMERDELGLKMDSILLSLRRATIFPLISLLLLLIGEIVCFLGHCNQRNLLTFISGIFFVVGGLCTLIGIIIYISAITEETGNKPKLPMDEPKFSYQYGPSFVMTISSFIASEMTGVLSVYLYIVQYKNGYRKRQKRLNSTTAAAHATNDRKQSRQRPPTATTSASPRENHSRGHTPPSSSSDSYYAYMPVSADALPSETTLRRTLTTRDDASRYTLHSSAAAMAVDAQVHLSRDRSRRSVREADTQRRTTIV